jgi:hypothetical protein
MQSWEDAHPMVRSNAPSFLRQNAFPIASASVLVIAAWVRMEMSYGELRDRVDDLEAGLAGLGNCGPDGFLSPASHSAHDLHVEHWMQQHLGERGWRRLQQQYSDGGRENPEPR